MFWFSYLPFIHSSALNGFYHVTNSRDIDGTWWHSRNQLKYFLWGAYTETKWQEFIEEVVEKKEPKNVKHAKCHAFLFSRMRSEGFPFIVGVWGWTCVRVACVASSSPTRRQLVANSLISLHWAVHSHCDTILTYKVWKVEEVSHEMLVLALRSHKIWGHFRVVRDRCNTLEACQCPRVGFSWQAQHFVMWPFAMPWQAQHFVMWAKVLFAQIAMAGTRKRDITSKIVAGAACGECLEKWRKLRKSHTFWAL